jgi:hypothetical protein
VLDLYIGVWNIKSMHSTQSIDEERVSSNFFGREKNKTSEKDMGFEQLRIRGFEGGVYSRS